MLRLRTAPLLIVSLFLASPAPSGEPAATVAIGQPAPPLVVSAWIRGGPVDRFEPGRVYVVDLWSTWCQPCLVTMPLLSRLQARYANDVTIIAMNVWEMKPKGVPAYVDSRGDSMAIAVATDSLPPGKEANEGLMALAWLGTSEHVAIPRTFLIDREGRVVWVGLPDELEGPLAQVIAGTWDMKPFAEKYEAEERFELRYRELYRPIEAAVAASEWEKAYQISEAVAAADTAFAARVANQGFAYIAMSILASKSATPADLAIAERSAARSIALQPSPDWLSFQLSARVARARGELDVARERFSAAIERAEGEDRVKLEAERKELDSGE
jgi:thiol-disulfide isomerase/thioredoxin